MRVSELIKQLEKAPPSLQVFVASQRHLRSGLTTASIVTERKVKPLSNNNDPGEDTYVLLAGAGASAGDDSDEH